MNGLILTCEEAAALLEIQPGTLRDRALRQGRVKIHRRSPLAFHINDILDEATATELKRRDPRGQKSTIHKLGRLTSCR